MAPRVQVDLSEDAPFNPNLFTGRGKTFPPGGADDIGSTEVLAVPSDIHHIPDAELPVTAFAALDLPEQFPAFILTNPRIWYRTDLPATVILHLMSRPIPSAEFLSQLKKEVGQAPFSSDTSAPKKRERERIRMNPLTLIWWSEKNESKKRTARERVLNRSASGTPKEYYTLHLSTWALLLSTSVHSEILLPAAGVYKFHRTMKMLTLMSRQLGNAALATEMNGGEVRNYIRRVRCDVPGTGRSVARALRVGDVLGGEPAPLTRAPVPVALTPAPVPVPLAPVAVANAEAELGVAAMAKSELVAKTGDVDEGRSIPNERESVGVKNARKNWNRLRRSPRKNASTISGEERKKRPLVDGNAPENKRGAR
ncbi:hypothetical protein B0H11DRAFT_1926004 [Mycena galericulata]|nr:hypothetical protein B0H11DRAFT_1926004 [Mycena galericulata]